MRKILSVILCLSLLAGMMCTVSAAPAAAEDITDSTRFSGSGYSSFDFLKDKNTDSYQTSSGNASITLTNEAGIASIYLLFDDLYGTYTVTDDNSGRTFTAGGDGFLHEFVDLASQFGTSPTSVTLSFTNGSVQLSELYVFNGLDVPDFVQVWSAPLNGNADLVLFSTHGDDEQLFFAGLLPYYAGELNYRVQVVYLTDHRSGLSDRSRIHEMLNGLWAVGVSAYPVFGSFADLWSEDLQDCYNAYRTYYNTTEEDLQRFVVEQIRRFRPLVAVGHDIAGEYSHGMHMVYTDVLIKALELAAEPTVFPESAEEYGVWELPKLYLHLYQENPITIDYDQPLEAFGGMTAFQVTQQLGFPCHKSQQWTWFTGWINGKHNEITEASQIEKYSPCEFGLYRSTVGADVEKNDFFENIITYAEQERLEQERLEQERLEQERLEQERLEQERLEQERLEQERLEQERLEQERLAQEQLKKEQLQAAAKRKQELTIAIAALVLLIAALICILIFRPGKKKSKK